MRWFVSSTWLRKCGLTITDQFGTRRRGDTCSWATSRTLGPSPETPNEPFHPLLLPQGAVDKLVTHYCAANPHRHYKR